MTTENASRLCGVLAGNEGMRLSNGAMHDACAIAAVAPTAMIFVPSRDGISHHQDEWLEPRDAAIGADLLFRVIESKAGSTLSRRSAE